MSTGEPAADLQAVDQVRIARRDELARTVSWELPDGAARMVAELAERVEYLEAGRAGTGIVREYSGAVLPSPATGLLPLEQQVLDLACTLWQAWLALPVEHPDDARDVAAAVHVVQDRLAMRIARRHYPAGWPRKE